MMKVEARQDLNQSYRIRITDMMVHKSHPTDGV